MEQYEKFIYQTSVLHRDSNSEEANPKSNGSWKWIHILKPIWKKLKTYDRENKALIAGNGIISTDDPLSDGKMYLRKNRYCYRVKNTQGNGLYLSPQPPYFPSGVTGEVLFVENRGKVYSGEGLILGANSPFKNIPILGLLLENEPIVIVGLK